MSRKFNFYKGEENTVIVEKEKFYDSLFIDQYKIALSLISKLVAKPQTDVPNLVAFCGDRGEGKTSCLLSVCNVLKCFDKIKDVDYACLSIDKGSIESAGFEVLDLIDPAFFDKEHNLVELLLGNIYHGFKNWQKEHKGQGMYEQSNNVSKLFQTVKNCLRHLNQSQTDFYDPLEELDILSAGVDLSCKMAELMRAYLALIGKKRLVISIDDIDLNMSRAYRMCEEIRKYLNNEHCMILLSVKIEQLTEAVENATHKDADFPDTMDFSGMAAKYVAKLIPVSMRVEMPKAYDLCEYELFIYNRRGDEQYLYHAKAVKEGVVRKIFETCRYLFYNSKGSVSPIVPNNLRSLSHLLGLLCNMPIFDTADLPEKLMNKHQFKAYFYKSWVKQLAPENQIFIRKLTEGQDGADTNKYVVHYLIDALNQVGACSGLIKEITEQSNYAYNVSVGDVLYIVSYLEKSSFDEELNRVLFFIKSYYSITLYERYDIVTEDVRKKLYPSKNDEGLLYRADAWYDNTNELQRTVSGSFFTYQPNELLPPTGRGEKEQSRDYKVVRGNQKGKGLTVLFNLINVGMQHYDAMSVADKAKFELRFRMAEYFALSVIRSIYEREIKVTVKLDRTQQLPYYLTPFNQNTGFYVYDVLSIFSNMTNFKYAYKRFFALADIYDFALSHEWSLIRKMLSKVRDKGITENNLVEEQQIRERFPRYEENEDTSLWHLYSNAIIRNSEVALAMMDNMRSKRYTVRDYSSNADLLAKFYESIIKSNMMTYNRPETEQPYYINFEFLRPVVELLNDATINQPDSLTINGHDEYLPKFDDIYDYVPKYKEIVTDKMVTTLFSASLRGYRKTDREHIISRIHDNQPNLYSAVSEETWLDILSGSYQYSREMLIDALRPYYNDFLDAIDEAPEPIEGLVEEGEIGGGGNPDVEAPDNLE